MTALLKKRALAEFSQTLVIPETEVPPKPKRLRIIKKSAESFEETSSTLETEILKLDAEKPASENFQIISRIVSSLPTSVRHMIHHYNPLSPK